MYKMLNSNWLYRDLMMRTLIKTCILTFILMSNSYEIYAFPLKSNITTKRKGQLFSFEIASFKNRNKAINFLLFLPEKLKRSSYIWKDKNSYKVRAYLFSSKKRLLNFLPEIETLGFTPKIVKTPDDFLYSIQLITNKTRQAAERFFKKLPQEIRTKAFVYQTDSGYFTVRVFLAQTRKEAKGLQKEIERSLSIKTFIVPTSKLKVAIKKEEKKEKQNNQTKIPIVEPSPKTPEGGKPEIIIRSVSPIQIKEPKKTKLKKLKEKELLNIEKESLKKEKKEQKLIRKKLQKILTESKKINHKSKQKEKMVREQGKEKKTTVVIPKKEPYIVGTSSFKSFFPFIDRNINFSAGWQYGESRKNGETTSFFSESYSLNTPGEITDGIKYSISLTYSKFYPEDTTWQSTFRPFLNTRLTNDIFTLSSSSGITTVKSSDGRDDKTTNYNINFSSTWNRKYPYLLITASKNRSLSETTDSESTGKRIATGYTYKNTVGITYSFSTSENTDNIRDTYTKNTNQNINFFGKKAFLNGKVFVSVSESINFSDNEYSLKKISGISYIKISPITALNNIDATPTDGTLTPNALLTDGDYSTSTGIDLKTPYENIAINTAYEPTDLITLYIGGNVTEAEIYTLLWDIYTSDDGNIWTPILTSTPFSFDNQTETIDFILPTTIKANYIKLVLKVTGIINTGYVTEIEAFGKTDNVTTDIIKTSTYGDTTRANIRVQLPYKLSYYLNYERASREGEEIISKISNGLSGSWKYKYYLFSSGIRRTDYFMKDVDKRVSQGINFDLKATPLNTLSWRTGTSYTENFIGSEKTTSAVTLTSGINAKLFTGLNTGLSGTVTRGTNEQTRTTNTSYNLRFDTNARLYPSLSVASSVQHNVSTETTDTMSISSTWTPSEILRFTISQGFTIISNGENRSTTSLNISIIPQGGDIKYNFGMSSSNGNNSYRGSVYWQISDYFVTNGYVKYEDFSETVTSGVNLNARW